MTSRIEWEPKPATITQPSGTNCFRHGDGKSSLKMNAASSPSALVMVRRTLDNLPAYPVPPGFLMKWFKPGDEARWVQIHLVAEREREITPELFRSEFGYDDGLLSKRQCFLMSDDGRAVGTATAWFSGYSQGELRPPTLDGHQDREPASEGSAGFPTGVPRADWKVGATVHGMRWGRVHWVAIAPECQGRGLGRALMTVVCERLRKLGHERAFLRTSATRLAALNLYLGFGFEPWPRDAAEEAVWRRLVPRLRGLASWKSN